MLSFNVIAYPRLCVGNRWTGQTSVLPREFGAARRPLMDEKLG